MRNTVRKKVLSEDAWVIVGSIYFTLMHNGLIQDERCLAFLFTDVCIEVT